VTLEGEVPVRPGFTCTADITTATRKQVLSVPIQATTVREVVLDANGRIVRAPRDQRGRRRDSGSVAAASAEELEPGQTRKELEGVFLVRDGRAEFTPIRTGIPGDRYFEVISGLETGARVIVGPFASVRELKDGDPVRIETPRTRS
jgi:HlyD family secretion protein